MGLLLFLLFIVVPLLELVVIIQVGQYLGAGLTVLLLLGISLAGAALVKREGIRAWQRFRQALAEGRVPAREVVDGALLMLGGALLLTPGFLTDGVGLALLVPPARAAVRGLLRRRFTIITTGSDKGPRPATARDRQPGGDHGVIDVEVVEVKRNDTPGDRGRS